MRCTLVTHVMFIRHSDTLKSAAKMVAAPMMEFYNKNQTEGIPGKLTDTWYVAGAMFMILIQYWYASSDDTYNTVVSHDLMFQSGENYDFFSKNYSHWLIGRQICPHILSMLTSFRVMTIRCSGDLPPSLLQRLGSQRSQTNPPGPPWRGQSSTCRLPDGIPRIVVAACDGRSPSICLVTR